jgi:hypothetical protein
MPQVAWADRLTLPPDSTGKPTGMVPVAVAGGTLYLPASVMVDAAGNTIDSATAAPAGTERGLVTRNIPSGTQPVSGTVGLAAGANNIGDVDVLSLPSLPAGANQIGTTLGPTITKGTQGATGYSTQDLKDAGRTLYKLFTAAPASTQATDTLLSLTGWKGAAVGATTTPAVVTAGKTLRIESIVVGYGSIATAGSVRVTMRYNATGVVALASPVLEVFSVGNGAPATAGAWGYLAIPFPDGIEIPAGAGIGFSAQGMGATLTGTAVGFVSVNLVGFEY